MGFHEKWAAPRSIPSLNFLENRQVSAPKAEGGLGHEGLEKHNYGTSELWHCLWGPWREGGATRCTGQQPRSKDWIPLDSGPCPGVLRGVAAETLIPATSLQLCCLHQAKSTNKLCARDCTQKRLPWGNGYAVPCRWQPSAHTATSMGLCCPHVANTGGSEESQPTRDGAGRSPSFLSPPLSATQPHLPAPFCP